jgi:hypothetical protein
VTKSSPRLVSFLTRRFLSGKRAVRDALLIAESRPRDMFTTLLTTSKRGNTN